MKNLLILGAAIVLIGLGAWYLLGREGDPPPPPVAATPPPSVAPAPEPIRHPAPLPTPPAAAPEQAPEPLPPLGRESDPALREVVGGLIGAEGAEQVGLADDLVRRIVVTIDNLPRERVPVRIRPVAPAPGQFTVAGDEDAPVIGAGNAARYEALARLFVSMPTEQVTDAYARFYPLFQQAYVELGYPDGYFNDRLVEVIDHLLEAPEIDGPVALVSPHVMFRFADPELEALSPGHKLLVRMGADNARALKAKLRELRAGLVSEG